MKKLWKKRIFGIFSSGIIILSMGASAVSSQAVHTEAKYSDISYSTPNYSSYEKTVRETVEYCTTQAEAELSAELMAELDTQYRTFMSMYAFNLIRNANDTKIPDYNTENQRAYYDIQLATDDYIKAVNAVAASQNAKAAEPYKTDPPKEYSEAAKELLLKESELLQKYMQLVASSKDTASITAMFSEIISVRNSLAAELGYESYAEYALAQTGYTVEEAKAFCAEAKKTIAPLYRQLAESFDETEITYVKTIAPTKFVADAVAAVEEYSLSDTEEITYFRDNEMFNFGNEQLRLKHDFIALLPEINAEYIFVTPAEDGFTTYLKTVRALGAYDVWYNSQINTAMAENTEIIGFASYMRGLSLVDAFSEDLALKSDKSKDFIRKYYLTATLEAFLKDMEHFEFQLEVYSVPEENFNKINMRLAKEYGIKSSTVTQLMLTDWAQEYGIVLEPFDCISYAAGGAAALEAYAKADSPQSAAKLYQGMISGGVYGDYGERLSANGLSKPLSKESLEAIAERISSGSNDSEQQAATEAAEAAVKEKKAPSDKDKSQILFNVIVTLLVLGLVGYGVYKWLTKTNPLM